VTVFLTSHDAGDIEQLCRRVVIINHGQVIHDGTVNALKRDYMKEREIDLRLGAPFAGELNLPGVRVLKAKGYGLKLAVDTSVAPIEATLGALLRECEVKDIAIAMPPMEQIIAAIYQGKGAVG
jgi:ABC-2 type transport system ATP-binding protein